MNDHPQPTVAPTAQPGLLAILARNASVHSECPICPPWANTAKKDNNGRIHPTVASLDFTMTRRQLERKPEPESLSSTQLDLAEQEYRRFLTLRVLHPDARLVPTELIDTFWHAHILDTRVYFFDCNTVFGHYLHHHPYLELSGDDSQNEMNSLFKMTEQLYRAHFGEEMCRAQSSAQGARCQDKACHVPSNCRCR